MSKSKCWIKTDYVPETTEYITSGKWYGVELCENKLGGSIKCDDGGSIFTALQGSSHIQGDWQVFYGGTPPDPLECSTSKDNTEGDTKVAGSAALPVNGVQDVTEEVVYFLSPVYGCWMPEGDQEWEWDEKFEELLDKLKSGEYSVIHNTNIN